MLEQGKGSFETDRDSLRRGLDYFSISSIAQTAIESIDPGVKLQYHSRVSTPVLNRSINREYRPRC